MYISLASFNIWFDNYEIYKRTSNLILEILNTIPRISVIALQEVRQCTLDFIMESNISNHYNIIKQPINQSGYDTIFLVNKEFVINKYIYHPFTHTKMNRNLKIISITHNEHTFLISTSHFESEFKIKNPNLYKISQINETFTILNKMIDENPDKYNLVVFMGDTNITSKEKNIKIPFLDNNWKDYFIEFGSPKYLEYTYDYTKNNNVKIPVKSRLDRIYYKNLKNIFEPYSFTFLGQEPNNYNIYTSDHFGILGSFMFEKN
jgi:exonuclease III